MLRNNEHDDWHYLIVDSASTGEHLAPAFEKILKKKNAIHVISSIDLLPGKLFHQAKNFLTQVVYESDLGKLLEQLKSYNIKFCIPGYESGVVLADQLNEALNLPGNGTAYSLARRDKYLMGEIIKNRGLKTVKQYNSHDSQEIIEWIKNENIKYPIVLKPLASANAQGVYFCDDQSKVIQAHQEILKGKNFFGKQNETVLAQEFNYGEEYIITTVSNEGKHYLCEIWHVIKRPGTTIYDNAKIVHAIEEEYFPLFDYTKQVLDALNIKFGAATTEVKYTSEGGAVLIECAARIMGGAPLSFCEKLFGYNQLSLTVESYLYPQKFLERLKQKPPLLENSGMAVILISDTAGKLKDELNLKEIESLPTFNSYTLNVHKGANLPKTIDTLTSPGEAYLVGLPEDLQRDYETIRELEENGLYVQAVEGKKNKCDMKGKSNILVWSKNSTTKTSGQASSNRNNGILNMKLS